MEQEEEVEVVEQFHSLADAGDIPGELGQVFEGSWVKTVEQAVGFLCASGIEVEGRDAFLARAREVLGEEALDEVFDLARDTEDYNIVKAERALKAVTDRSLLIIVDTNRPMLVECPELAEVCKTRIIIDHHRLTEDSYQNSAVAYIESYASSASELLAELMQHFSQKRFINKLEAEVMLAGIMVDSNHFSVRTGVRTFDAASWLKRGGADTTEVKRFFQVSEGDFRAKSGAIAGAEYTEEGVAYAVTEGISTNTQIINAQVADELMTVKGTKAAFVLGRNELGQTIVSARSLGDINVQALMEKLGGGGHFTSAAAQTITLNYSGNGYPIACIIVLDEDDGILNSTYTNTVARYSIAQYFMTKTYMDTTPTYATSGNANMGAVASVYKSSASTAATLTRTSSASVNTFSSSNSSGSTTTCVRFKSKTTMSVYSGANSGTSRYGFFSGLTYRYWIIYSE